MIDPDDPRGLPRLRIGRLSPETDAALEALAVEVGGLDATLGIATAPRCTVDSCGCGMPPAERAHYAGEHRRKDPR